MSEDKFKISLRENGEHSFKRSLESYKEYDRTKDQMLLKDTIMFLHQSVELLTKQMLVNHSPYLIFEDLRDIPKKQKEANKQSIGIFFLDKPPRSVTYEVAIDRVEAFLNPPELDDNLKENLDKLNRLRNQLEHYEIDADRDEVVRILEAIHKPALNLFEKYLGTLTQLQTPQIYQTWKRIDQDRQNSIQKNHEVLMLVQKFNGQKVPGRLLGVDREVILPKFEDVEENVIISKGLNGQNLRIEVDILAQRDVTFKMTWIIETKVNTVRMADIHRMSSYSNLLTATPWIVAFSDIHASNYSMAKETHVMITGPREWEELNNLVSPPVHPL